MPISAENKARYPANWKAISFSIRQRANNRCEDCGAENGNPHPITGSKVVLTVAHLNHNPPDCDPYNLRAMCQRCHLAYDKDLHLKNSAQTQRLKKRGQAS